jgi:NADPH:quinone reductase-like Zn-dependent oxidoreductase
MMKAVVYDEFGSPEVLRFEDIDIPSVSPNEVLVRVHAASLNPFDWHYMRGLPYVMRLMGFGLRKPKTTRILGSDMAGAVEEVGEDVTIFKPGDHVYSEVGFGACAEYVGIGADQLCLKPANTTFESAAAVPMAAQTALIGLRDKVSIRPGHRVLINGASEEGSEPSRCRSQRRLTPR